MNESRPPSPSAEAVIPVLTIPCPLCRHVFECPFAQQPRDECLDLWPLGRPSRRELPNRDTPEVREKLRLVAGHPELQALLRAWEEGQMLSDEQYLRLQDIATTQYRDPREDRAALWVAMLLLKHVWSVHVQAAHDYYPAQGAPGAEWQDLVLQAIRGALVVTTEEVTASDSAAPVGSHFERLFGDALKYILWGLWRAPTVKLPLQDAAFQTDLEFEWKGALCFGNGLYGLSVIPCISVTDLLRYQELGGRDPVVSRGIAEHFMLMLGTFPPLVQLLFPRFGELAFERRLLIMFEPMVKRYAGRAFRRAAMAGDAADIDRERLRGEFMSALESALDTYEFSYGKATGPEGVAGMLGLSADPEPRRRVGEALEHLQLAQTVRDITPVGIAHYVKARMDAHLREAYPVPGREKRRAVSLDAAGHEPLARQAEVGDEAEAEGSVWDSIRDDDDREWLGETGTEIPDVLACEVDGVKYLYADEMARVCGVTSHQLRHWDRSGDLPARRLGEVAPSPPGSPEAADWRVYPWTPEMIVTVRALAAAKAARRGGMAEGEFSRAAAARVLGVAAKTLKRWERAGIAQPQRREGKPVYIAKEIERLAPRSPRNKA